MIKIGNFPEIVNENAARIVAFFVICLCILAVFFNSILVTSILLYGFIARVLYGPRFDPIAQFTLQIIIPGLNIRYIPTPGVPKRFAQFIGFLFSLTGFSFLVLGYHYEFSITLSILSFFAFLESFFGFCAGCLGFKLLMNWGIIPDDVCERCNNISYDI